MITSTACLLSKKKFFDWKAYGHLIDANTHYQHYLIDLWVSYYFHIILLLIFSFFPFSLIIISAPITSSPYPVLSLLPQAFLLPILFRALPSLQLSVWVQPIFQLRVQHSCLRQVTLGLQVAVVVKTRTSSFLAYFFFFLCLSVRQLIYFNYIFYNGNLTIRQQTTLSVSHRLWI